jgi:hypothetical protein
VQSEALRHVRPPPKTLNPEPLYTPQPLLSISPSALRLCSEIWVENLGLRRYRTRAPLSRVEGIGLPHYRTQAPLFRVEGIGLRRYRTQALPHSIGLYVRTERGTGRGIYGPSECPSTHAHSSAQSQTQLVCTSPCVCSRLRRSPCVCLRLRRSPCVRLRLRRSPCACARVLWL